MATYTRKELIEAIELSLASQYTLVQAINKLKSDNPNPTGSSAVKEEDLPDIEPSEIDLMLSSKSVIERIGKRAKADDNSNNATTLSDVKKTVRRMDTKKNSFTKLEENVKSLRKTLGLDKEKKGAKKADK